jgi:molybdate transport system permease protein
MTWPPPELFHIAWLTVVTAAAATLLMLPAGVGMGWVLARRTFAGKTLVETLVALPLVMPPVATGLILLVLFARTGPLGSLLTRVGLDIVFTWKAVVIAMTVMGLPLVARTARAGFEQVDRRYEDIAATLGAAPLRIFRTVSLPLARRAILAGTLLGFARAVGEFGATIMVAGSIPGETRTLAVAIYSYTEVGQHAAAGWILSVSVLLAFLALSMANRLSRQT